jgi:hypothetical protein
VGEFQHVPQLLRVRVLRKQHRHLLLDMHVRLDGIQDIARWYLRQLFRLHFVKPSAISSSRSATARMAGEVGFSRAFAILSARSKTSSTTIRRSTTNQIRRAFLRFGSLACAASAYTAAPASELRVGVDRQPVGNEFCSGERTDIARGDGQVCGRHPDVPGQKLRPTFCAPSIRGSLKSGWRERF